MSIEITPALLADIKAKAKAATYDACANIRDDIVETRPDRVWQKACDMETETFIRYLAA